MSDKPILFSGPMVRALLAGTKTQTRRVLKPQPIGFDWYDLKCKPRISVGDRLWVREAHALLPRTAYRGSIGTGTIAQREHPTDGYTAAVFREGFDRSGRPQWRPSIHMPRWASRLTLIVSNVRIERLQDISEADAIAEGIQEKDGWWFGPESADTSIATSSPMDAYRILWNAINGPEAWDTNPWVVAYTFAVIKQNIDEVSQ